MTSLQKLSTSLNPRLKAITRIIELNGMEHHKIVVEHKQEAAKHILGPTVHLENGIHTLFSKIDFKSFGHFSLTNAGKQDDTRNHVTSLEKNI